MAADPNTSGADSVNAPSTNAQRIETPQAIITIFAGLISAVAVLSYPLGFIMTWIQIHNTYGYSQKTALYATQLLPTSFVAGNVVSALPWVPLIIPLMWFYAMYTVVSSLGILSGDTEPKPVPSRLGLLLRMLGILLMWIVPGAAFYFFQHMTSSASEGSELIIVGLSIVFTLLVIFGGLLWVWPGVQFLTQARQDEDTEGGRANRQAWNWSTILNAYLILLVVNTMVILAAACIVAARPLKLPVADLRLQDQKLKTINLLANSDGAWYGIDPEQDSTIIAIPSQKVDEVEISR